MYSYNFEGRPVPNLDDPNQRWIMVIHPRPDQMQFNLRNECKNRAIELSHKAAREGREIMLHISGGDDSVAMALSFIAAGVQFRATTRRYTWQSEVTNQEDVDASIAFCERMGVPHEVRTIDGIQHIWQHTSHEFLRDMTVLGARLGWEAYPDYLNVLGTSPFITSLGDVWSLRALFSVETLYTESFFSSPGIFWALIEDPAMTAMEHGLGSLHALMHDKFGGHLKDVMVYEAIVKPAIMARAFPELKAHPRAKSTGFDSHLMDYMPAWQNKRYIELLRQKTFRVPLKELRVNSDVVQRYWKTANGTIEKSLP